MKYGFFESPLGIIKISYEAKIRKIELVDEIDENSEENEPVSYTHLTLPTSDLV